MSIDILFELQHEVRRLFVAGSGLAAGDVRLKKILPQLERLGESAPIFKRMAQGVAQVVEPEAGSGAIKLLELSTLLNSVLYTQGKTESSQEGMQWIEVEGTDTKLNTPLSYRKLYPAVEALTQKGQGRMEQLLQAYEESRLQDIRVILPAVSALDDSYAEMADFVYEKLIPAYGAEAQTVLAEQFKLEGGRGHARRLMLLHPLLGEAGTDFVLQAAREGSNEVRSAAIEILGDYPEQESFILEQADAKKKEIRKSALLALAKLGTESAVQRLLSALNSKDRDIAIEPIQQCASAALTQGIIQYAESVLDRIIQKTDVEASIQSLRDSLRCLDGKKDNGILGLLEKILSNPKAVTREMDEALQAAADLLLELEQPDADRFAMSLLHINRKLIAQSFRAAARNLSSTELYEQYADSFKEKRKAAGKELKWAFYSLVPSQTEQYLEGDIEEEGEEYLPIEHWDKRWVDLFVDIDDEDLVCRLANRSTPKIMDYLAKKCKESSDAFNDYEKVDLLLALFRLQHKEAPELLMQALEKDASKRLYYIGESQRILLASLPASYAQRMEAAVGKLSYDGVKKQLMDIVETLKAKPEQTDADEKGTGLWGWIKNKMS
ncbi:HEAT repeat domain-containing protein [Paenibacillus eucommiae]|uniref:HEAT repeat protein n=1 Tax=Paenibacillus eucommiae TaxID=1355755 RepID=A0ABS4IY46_9BACL|nr:HEAT repeat domain-containing protein [Paenibacillus eucommiae]MBP1991906.1 HEAT repeat protein [Paenibacillus eucommiae]